MIPLLITIFTNNVAVELVLLEFETHLSKINDNYIFGKVDVFWWHEEAVFIDDNHESSVILLQLHSGTLKRFFAFQQEDICTSNITNYQIILHSIHKIYSNHETVFVVPCQGTPR